MSDGSNYTNRQLALQKQRQFPQTITNISSELGKGLEAAIKRQLGLSK